MTQEGRTARGRFAKGHSGNPGGRSKEKPMAAMIREVAAEIDPATGRSRLDLIVAKLVEKALAGDVASIVMIADRLDGKPAVAVAHAGDVALSDADKIERLG